MDVDGAHFKGELLSILKHISNATFVAIDLEMSGITTRPRYQPGDRSLDANKPTLQAQYEETKDAAEAFQVLQIGITCLEEDHERDYYLARPYNFTLSPLLQDKGGLNIERRFTFSSSAASFLHNEGFNFGKVFTSGVPYLSEEEEIAAREGYQEQINRRSRIPDLSLDDAAAETFYNNARQLIANWVTAAEPKLDFVNISCPSGPLNGYQRRLIHQLVRKEFPGYRAFACNGVWFMQIVKIDAASEFREAKKKQEQFNDKIANQKGLRFIFDALTGGSLTDINPAWFLDDRSETYSLDKHRFQIELANICKSLRLHPTILVGHNVFTDLAFLYRTFVGKLPQQVTQFQRSIHLLFPRVVDTKFLATHGASSMGAKSNLSECLEPFKRIHKPLVLMHEKFSKYTSAFGRTHEAGFDSWMTAELFIKLTAHLHLNFRRQLAGLSSSSDSSTVSNESSDTNDGGVPLSPNVRNGKSARSPDDAGGYTLPESCRFTASTFDRLHANDSPPNGNRNSNHTNLSPDRSLQTNLPPEWHARQLNSFSALAMDTSPSKSSNHGASDDEIEQKEEEMHQWIPAMMDEENEYFWGMYRNRLRVAGTDTGVCDLEEW